MAKREISSPKIGMNRSASHDNLEAMEYSLQVNGSSVDSNGNKGDKSFEPSNIKAVNFPDGFKVVGRETDIISNTTYYFITNPTTGVSQFGKVDNVNTENISIQQPLESSNQLPHQSYQTLLEDSCNLCLNLSVNRPILSIEIKRENIGNRLYFTDGTKGTSDNTVRVIDLDNLDKYKYLGTDTCNSTTTPTCLDCEKLELTRKYTNPKLKDIQEVSGGRLKEGTYENFFAYCDVLGNEISDSISITPVYPIFDETTILQEVVENATTNKAVKVTLENIDTDAPHYKIISRYYSSKGVYVDYEVGIFSTSNPTFLVSSSEGIPVSDSKIFLKRPIVKAADSIEAANNLLFLTGVRQKEPWNLQPVVNFMSLGLKWMSFRANEDLYKKTNSYIFCGYNRDEVTEIGISFEIDSFYETNVFPFIQRPAKSSEVAILPQTDRDYLSLSPKEGREKVWQVKNTATLDDVFPEFDCGINIETVSQSQQTTSYTIVNVPSVPAGTLVIEAEDIPVDFTISNYIEDNISDCSVAGTPLEEAGLCSYIDITNLTGYNNLPSNPEECADEFETGCCDPYTVEDSLIEETVEVSSVDGESITLTQKKLEDYPRVRLPESCVVYDSGNEDRDYSSQFSLRYSSSGIEIEGTINKRLNVTYADTPSVAYETPLINSGNIRSSYAPSMVHPYYGANLAATTGTFEEIFANNLTSKNALYTATFNRDQIGGLSDSQSTIVGHAGVFTNKIHNGALWFKVRVEGLDSALVEITRLTNISAIGYRLDGNIRNFRNTIVRVHFFSSSRSSDVNPITTTSYEDENGVSTISLGGIIDLRTTPELIPLDQSVISQSTDGYIYGVIDLPLSESIGLGENVFILEDGSTSEPAAEKIPTGITIPLSSCFSINQRSSEISKVVATFDSINIQKRQRYETTCNYEVPVITEDKPVPYQSGELGYYESTDTIPDNEELYDSTALVIAPGDITNLNVRQKYEDFYATSAQDYTPNEQADFRCKPNRFFKLPDNKISPFINTTKTRDSSDSIISPLGFYLEENVVEDFINIAVSNGLITQSQKESITGYKIHRADATLSRSVLSSGLLFQTKSYQDKQRGRTKYINFPYNSLGKNKYAQDTHESEDDQITYGSIHSPELDYYQKTSGTELSLQGYMFGGSANTFDEMRGHSKMIILGGKSRTLATVLAIAEVTSELLINQYLGSEAYRVQLGVASSANPVGVGLGIAVAAIGVIGSVFKVGRYRYQWLETFEGLGKPVNFGYQHMSVGKYSYMMSPTTVDDNLRGISLMKNIKPGFLNITDSKTGESFKLNNYQRERSTFVSLGEHSLDISSALTYLNYDNSNINPNISSQPLSSESNCEVGLHDEFFRNIASPYVALKNYISNQYGVLNSIRWVDTGYSFKLNENTQCKGILGGDTFISRHTVNRKAPIFLTDLYGQGDDTAFNYEDYSNYGKAKYYINYKDTGQTGLAASLFPNIDYDIKTDCGDSNNNFYLKAPSKFYLQSRGVASFLTETRINTNFRKGKLPLKDQFYPQNTDYTELQQQENVSIKDRESFSYPSSYSNVEKALAGFSLLPSYSSEDEAKKAYNPNFVMYSRPDANENSVVDPWSNFRPNDAYTFKTPYGNLNGFTAIESEQVMANFENETVLFNAVDAMVDGITVENADFGTGGVFARRPRTFRSTSLGYMGSQSNAVLSCEFGHFKADTKRGQVFKINPGGQGIQEISRYSGQKLNGMDVWFKEHLPFKFLRDFPKYNYLDNPYNGIGVHWGFDSKYRRIFLTKKDYVLKQGINLQYDKETNTFAGEDFQYHVDNGNFEEVSWTICYIPEEGFWDTYMSYKPNYYVNHSDYFQSGINSNDNEKGLWSHLLTNESYRVFYGKKYPYVIEYPIKRVPESTRLDVVKWKAILKKYNAKHDYSLVQDNPFTKVSIFNHHEHSGELEPIKNNGSIRQLSKYPITTPNNTQQVLLSYDDYKYNLNYFYNRVLTENSGEPNFINGINQIDKVVNPLAVGFKSKKVLERLKGHNFMIRLESDIDSNLDMELKWSEQTLNNDRQ